MQEDLVDTLLTIGNLESIAALNKLSLLCQVEGHALQEKIDKKVTYLSALNNLDKQFVDWNFIGHACPIETFTQLLEAYDCRYIEKSLLSSPEELYQYLLSTSGINIPILILRSFYLVENKQGIYGQLLAEVLVRLTDHEELLEEHWNNFLMYHEETDEDLEAYISEDLEWLWIAVVEALANKERVVKLFSLLCAVEYLPALTNQAFRLPISIQNEIIIDFLSNLENPDKFVEQYAFVYDIIDDLILDGDLTVLVFVLEKMPNMDPMFYKRASRVLAVASKVDVSSILTLPYHQTFMSLLISQAQKRNQELHPQLLALYPEL